MSAGTSCPECAGPRLPDHPAGTLTISHDPGCTLGAAEDSTRAADAELLAARPYLRRWSRTTTTAERTLVAHLVGVAPDAVPDDVQVHAVVGPAVLRRSWPELEQEG